MTQTNTLVQYKIGEEEIRLTPKEVYTQLVSADTSKNLTDAEVYNFLNLCKYKKLNPFLKEAHLVKYSKQAPAQMVVGKDYFTKKACQNPLCKGFKSGIIVTSSNNQIQYREGTFYIKGKENLVGGWAEVYRKDWTIPYKTTVSFQEYNSGKSIWATKPATMIKKVALVQALREAIPEEFEALYDGSEMNIDTEEEQAKIQTRNNKAQDEIEEAEIIEEEEMPLKNAPELDEINKSSQEEKQNLKANKDENKVSMPQIKRLFAMVSVMGKEGESFLRNLIKEYGYTSTKDITTTDYERICQNIEEITKQEEPLPEFLQQ